MKQIPYLYQQIITEYTVRVADLNEDRTAFEILQNIT